MVNISVGTALVAALLGYMVVFIGILFLMAVISIGGKVLAKKNTAALRPANAAAAGSDLGNLKATAGVNPKIVAAAAAAIAEMEREGL